MKKIIRLTKSELVEVIKKSSKMITVKRIDKYTPSNPYERQIQVGDNEVVLKNVDTNTVQEVLRDLPKSIRILGILYCEGVDFSDSNICDLPKLLIVNLIGTPNNFEEKVNCEYEILNSSLGLYEFDNDI